jgi:hypothetical protein
MFTTIEIFKLFLIYITIATILTVFWCIAVDSFR